MRPKIWHHVMTGLSALTLLGTTVFAIVRWGSLDGKIPTHFDSAGQPTSYGGPEALIVLLVMAWVMLAGLTAVSFFPNIWNVPVRTPRTLAATADMFAVMRLVITLMLCWLVFCSVQGRDLGAWFMPVTMVGLFGPVVYLLVACARK